MKINDLALKLSNPESYKDKLQMSYDNINNDKEDSTSPAPCRKKRELRSLKKIESFRSETIFSDDYRTNAQIWLSPSIKNKSREVLKRQMAGYINRMKVQKFIFHE